MKAYILTVAYNDYDQHGDYFLAWFHQKPTIEDLKRITKEDQNTLEHILNGGGRREYEDQWYILTEVESSNR